MQSAKRWERKRLELLPWPYSRRRLVAERLGLDIRTIERYEAGAAPRWYELALLGLSVRLKKQKP